MKVSAVSQDNCRPRRNWFIQYSNSFMSSPEIENPIEKANVANTKKNEKMGIENLEEFTIFPKQVVNGTTIITA